jgi:hypothetical protein
MKSQTNTTSRSGPTLNSAAILQAALAEPIVRVVGYAYLVDMGPGVKPRLHTVHKDRTCNCGQAECPAVLVVAEWLKAGRIERAPEPPAGYTPYLPSVCPVCGATVTADHTLSSRTRGVGWRCLTGGIAHYWQNKWEALKGWFFRPVIIPGALKREDVPDGLPMGYLPEANRASGRSTDEAEP